MPTLNRKRRAATDADSDSDASPAPRSRAPAKAPSRSTTTSVQPRRRRPSPSPSASVTENGTPQPNGNTHTLTSQQTKALVRLALSTHASRTPLRRPEINARCGTSPATFKTVFAEAQAVLMRVWGMRMVELPRGEKVSVAERRREVASQIAGGKGAAAADKGGNGWILTSILPSGIRGVLGTHVFEGGETGDKEASYTALISFIVSLIALSGGSMEDKKVERMLGRVNAEHTTPVSATPALLKRMEREGYLQRIVTNLPGEEANVEFRVGPRGKVEVGEPGIRGLVREVYGLRANGEVEHGLTDAQRERQEEVERRIESSLKISRAGSRDVMDEVDGEGATGAAANGQSRGKVRRKRSMRQDESEDDD